MALLRDMPPFVPAERTASSIGPSDLQTSAPRRFYGVARQRSITRLVGRCNTFHLLQFPDRLRLSASGEFPPGCLAFAGRIAPARGAANGRYKDSLAVSTHLDSPGT